MENRVKLDDLEANSNTVRQTVATCIYQAFQFESGATKLKKRYQWEQYRTMILVGSLGVVDLGNSDLFGSTLEDALNTVYSLLETKSGVTI